MNSANDTTPTVEAILLFKGAEVVEQMLYSEFEGVLDHVTCIPDYADERVKGCYANVTPDLAITGIIFFYIDFDEHGYADRSWSLPLRRLMGMAGQGPDLGAGPIQLVCRTRCPQPEMREELWDPSIQPGMNHFQILKQAIQQNELNINQQLAVSQSSSMGCIDVALAQSQVVESEESKNRRDKLAEIIKSQRFRIEALTNECKDKVDALERARRHDQIQYNEHKRMFSQKFEQLKVRYLKREEQLNNAVSLIARMLDVEDAEVIKEHLDDLRAVGNLADLSTGDGNAEQMELIQTKAENYLLTQQLVQLKRICNAMNKKMRDMEGTDIPTVVPMASKSA
ncbi:hypothetical protein [Litoribrevibacter albus]|uniref:Uncharacterized protein n=1 Tax=Litoribrevibacter albus TaxID=1473156 RepID=A0AA37SD63_9GAMM|nr:hypothetical protein [Litoribrevibacter albus]GLQ32312.1 hypothetical protein GCM10007876_27910 [Litoribrevibacter albus]